jgi:hypothetical protein
LTCRLYAPLYWLFWFRVTRYMFWYAVMILLSQIQIGLALAFMLIILLLGKRTRRTVMHQLPHVRKCIWDTSP